MCTAAQSPAASSPVRNRLTAARKTACTQPTPAPAERAPLACLVTQPLPCPRLAAPRLHCISAELILRSRLRCRGQQECGCCQQPPARPHHRRSGPSGGCSRMGRRRQGGGGKSLRRCVRSHEPAAIALRSCAALASRRLGPANAKMKSQNAFWSAHSAHQRMLVRVVQVGQGGAASAENPTRADNTGCWACSLA